MGTLHGLCKTKYHPPPPKKKERERERESAKEDQQIPAVKKREISSQMSVVSSAFFTLKKKKTTVPVDRISLKVSTHSFNSELFTKCFTCLSSSKARMFFSTPLS